MRLAFEKTDEIDEMRYRTAVKTRRTTALQLEALRRGSFSQYAAMVQRFSSGYLRPLVLRSSSPRKSR